MEGKTQESEITLENYESATLCLSEMSHLLTALFSDFVPMFSVQICLCRIVSVPFKAAVVRRLPNST